MSLHRKYLRILSALTSTTAVGAALLLASSAPSDARPAPVATEPRDTVTPPVSERLAAIRDAVSDVAAQQGDAAKRGAGERLMAWGNWGNGGFGFGFGVPWNNWNNWHDWNNWKDWRNGWGNAWHNW